MKENWERLEKDARIRLVVLALIVLWCAYSVIGYTWEIYHLDVQNGVVDTTSSAPVLIDGSDLTPLFQLMGGSLNSFWVLIVYTVYTVVMIVVSFVPMLVYWFAAIRKQERIHPAEAELSLNICGLGGFLGVIIGIVFTGFHTKFPPAWFTLCWMFWAFLLVILPLRRRLAPTEISPNTTLR